MNSYSSVRVFVTLIIIIMIIIVLLPPSSFGAVLTPSRPIKDGDILISANGNFALGFFSPGGTSSDHRYLGIWYNKIPETTVVWVANRESPVRGKTGVLTFDQRTGGLSIYGHEDDESPIWSSTEVSSEKNVSLAAELLDIGNLVLSGENGSLLWQSFDHPTDTMLPFMTIGVNRVTRQARFLNSWKAAGDPGPGNFTLGIDTAGHPQLFLKENGVPRWRGGPWTGLRWAGVPEMTPNFIFNVSYKDSPDEVSITYGILNQSIFSRMVLDQSGVVYRSTWHGPERGWIQFWSAPSHLCDNYGQCGANGYCDPLDSNIRSECTCLPGFEPKESREWDLRDWSGGCIRVRALGCGDGDGFVKLERVKVPDMSLGVRVVGSGMSIKACEEECRGNCSCVAYAWANESSGGSRCVTWYGKMVDTRSFTTVGQQLYVRVDAITLAKYKQNSSNWLNLKVKLAIALSCTVIVLLILIVVFALARKKRKVKNQQPRFYTVSIDTNSPAFSQDMHSKRDLGESRSNSELPLFNLNTIATATDNFSYQNKLGEGGFGPVYKGMLRDGKEIAVKRLSKHSGQGTEEFKNELLLIANLQHRNLVRILGCCVQGHEKMIIYEYLPNKSLDFCIFDETKKTTIDWTKRFEIICGIARGLLYLHQDSRLRIIHRDLKASNILLDTDMNPKIADFGMARIFGGDQKEANTNRVVGTYGYMSPEYAMGGRFSTKSDVYSFGVLLLEIITGKKNTSYFPEYPDSNLVGYVWELWTRGKALELVDPCLDECYASEALRCIEIGLLCVQDYAADRPNMSTVVFMLGNETAVPKPKQPAFVFKTSHTKGDLSISEGAESINDVTCTIVEAR